MADVARRILAYALACLAAATALFVLSLLFAPGSGSPSEGLDEPALRFGIALYYVALAGTPFSMIVLLILRLTGRSNRIWLVLGGAAAGLMPIAFIAAMLGGPFDIPASAAMMAALSGAVGGAVYHAAAPARYVA